MATQALAPSQKFEMILLGIKSSLSMPNVVARSRCGRYVQLEGISDDPIPYWDDPRIHNFGNNSWISATCAPIATKIIDMAAYDGIDLRKKIY
jgi:hypothetical protein